MKKIIFTAALAIMVASCTTYKFAALYQLRRGMSYQEAKQVLTDENYDGMETISSYESDTYTEKIENDSIRIVFMMKEYQARTKNDEALYIFAFQNDKLIYWGFPYEFTLSQNAKYSKIGTKAMEIANTKYKDQIDD